MKVSISSSCPRKQRELTRALHGVRRCGRKKVKFAALHVNGKAALVIDTNHGPRGFAEGDSEYPGDLLTLLAQGQPALLGAGKRLASGREFDPTQVHFLPPLPRPPKIICIGLNYAEHSREG